MSRLQVLAVAMSFGVIFVASHERTSSAAPMISGPKPIPITPIVLPDIRNGVEYSLSPCSLFAVPQDSFALCEYVGINKTDYGPCLFGLTSKYWLKSTKGDAWDSAFAWASGNYVKNATGPIACTSPSQTGFVTLSARPRQTLAEVHGYYETDRTKRARATFSGEVYRPANAANTPLVLKLQAQDPTTLEWMDRGSQVLPTSGSVEIELNATIEEYTELRVQLVSEGFIVKSPKPAPLVVVNDVRLFVGKCIPDTSKPGECLP